MTRFFGLMMALALLAASEGRAEPRFLIERIAIEGLRWASPRILVAESHLTEGREYGEVELRDAAARIHRLPFVLRADFRLEKGSERGKFVLVIAVVETKPFFLGYDSLQQSVEGQRSSVDQPTLGMRWFVGARGVAAASYDRQDLNRFGLGYTQYDLFGTRASLAATLQYSERSIHPLAGWSGPSGTRFDDHLTYGLTAAVPLFANQAVRLSWLRRTDFLATSDENGDVHFQRSPSDTPELAWVYDTTDDALLPERGTLVRAAWQPSRFTLLTLHPHTSIATASRSWLNGYDLTAARHWELTPVHSLAATGEVLTHGDGRARETHAGVEWDARLGAPAASPFAINDLRLELGLEKVYFQGTGSPPSQTTAHAGLVFRNEWAIVHVGVSYTGWGQGVR
jgi:hypothetical protein